MATVNKPHRQAKCVAAVIVVVAVVALRTSVVEVPSLASAARMGRCQTSKWQLRGVAVACGGGAVAAAGAVAAMREMTETWILLRFAIFTNDWRTNN